MPLGIGGCVPLASRPVLPASSVHDRQPAPALASATAIAIETTEHGSEGARRITGL